MSVVLYRPGPSYLPPRAMVKLTRQICDSKPKVALPSSCQGHVCAGTESAYSFSACRIRYAGLRGQILQETLGRGQLLNKWDSHSRTENQSMLFEFHPRAIGAGEGSGESGAEEEHLYGIVDPNQDDDQGSSSPIGGTERCLSQVQTDSQLAEREEEGRYGCSEQNIAPVNLQVGKHLVDDGEQQG